MKKIAIFTEGQSEQIFIRHLLINLIGYGDLSFKCKKLYRDSFDDVPYQFDSPDPKFHFLIINTCGDEKVLSVIIERVDTLRSAGFEKFIGIRDMYCDIYQKKSPDRIDEALNQQIIISANKAIQNMDNPNQIILHFSVMEMEAWILSMYNLFPKINENLTLDFINENLGYNLSEIDPQQEFYKPSEDLNNIFSLVGLSYKKKFSQMESICSNIVGLDYENAIENGRCKNFVNLYSDINPVQ